MPRRNNVQGLDALVATLRKLPGELKGNPLRSSLRAGVNVFREDAVRRAPQSDLGDQGRLKANIMTRAVPAKDLPSGSADGQEVFVRQRGGKNAPTNAFYWRFVEFGTVNQSAQPFLRPAFETNGQNAINVFSDTFRRQVDRAVEQAKKR